MPDMPVRVLLDQNIPEVVAHWLREQRPRWEVKHVKEVDLAGQPDDVLFRWAQANKSIVVTYDEDFADARSHPLGEHQGIVRLRVWPTTIEQTEWALIRMLESVPEEQLHGSLIIVDNNKIRIRRRRDA